MRFTFDTREKADEFVEEVNRLCCEKGVVKYGDTLAMCGEKFGWRDQGVGWTDVSSFIVVDSSVVTHEYTVCTDDPIDLNKGMYGTTEPDNVNHPNHYKTKNGLETIQVIEAFTDGLEGIEATDTGNVIKYICRWKKKNGLEDLKKAQWYLIHLINHVEKENES